MRRPGYRSSIFRRVLLAVLVSVLLALAGIVVVAYTAGSVAFPTSFEEVQALIAGVAPSWTLIVAVIALALLVVLLLVRWAVQPVDQLVSAAATLAKDAGSTSSMAAVGEVNQLNRNFGELSELLLRSSRELERQNSLMANSVGRLEHLLKAGQEFSTTVDTDQLLRRAARTLQEQLGYEHASVALVEGETLAFYLDGASSNHNGMPLRVPLNDSSIVGRAALAGVAQRGDDLSNQNGVAEPRLANARSVYAMPIIYGRQVLAVLVVQSTSPAAFSEQDAEQLTVLAQMLAAALANSGRFHDEQLRRQLAEATYLVSQKLSDGIAAEHVPELILDQLAQLLPADRSALLFIEGDQIETVATRGHRSDAVVSRRRTPLAELPLIAEIIAQGQTLVLADAMQDVRYQPVPGGAPARSWLGAPLMRFGLVIGVLVLESDQTGRYGREEQAALTAIAYQAATALENARLYSEVQDRALRLEVITELTNLVSTRDVLRELHSILRTAIHRIRRVVPCDYAALALYNEDDDTFSVETVYNFAVRDWADLPAGIRVAADNTSWQMACRTTGPLLQSDLAHSAFVEERQLTENGLQSSIVVPILGAKQAIGALTFASSDRQAYGPPQVATLVELANYLGPALYNARLNREREAAANQLAQTQEYLNLVDKVRVVGQLASGVAHDFNNLLAGILGNAQLLLYEIQDAEQRDMLRVIERAAKDGSETVRRLQGFARMEHDSPMTEVRLDMLARDAIDITRPRWRDVAQSRGVTIEIVRDLRPVTPIAGRPAELREVLTNLVINAVDAMPKGGSITLKSYDDLENIQHPGVVLEVADQGIGMSPELQARIFDPFFTTKGEHGTGLGLAVSLGIVEGHGGQIEVDSRVGEGTRFIIRLPVRAPESVEQAVEAAGTEIVPGHLLLVEGEPMIRDSIVRLLERWGHRVSQARGGVEALQTFSPERFDSVLCDQGMPDMSGWDVLAQIKQREPSIPTILMTGWGRQQTDEEARERGVDFIIEKPFDQIELRRILAKALNGSKSAE